MAVPVACPHCGHFSSMSEDMYDALSGMTTKCNKCGKTFVVQRAVAPATAAVHARPSSAPSRN